MRRLKLYLLLWWDFRDIVSVINRRDLLLFYFPFYFTRRSRLIGLRIRSLSGKKIFIRRGSFIDRDVLKYVFCDRYHLPAQKLSARAVILDIGSNIGLTIRHLKESYPDARIIGYEMDDSNYKIALQNCMDLKDCRINQNAVWSKAGEVQYDKTAYEDGYTVGEIVSQPGKMHKVTAVTMEDIFREHRLDKVDYLKMDIEGAEEVVLLSGNLCWLRHIGELNIECHNIAFLNKILPVIISYGFDAWQDRNHFCMIRALNTGVNIPGRHRNKRDN